MLKGKGVVVVVRQFLIGRACAGAQARVRESVRRAEEVDAYRKKSAHMFVLADVACQCARDYGATTELTAVRGVTS